MRRLYVAPRDLAHQYADIFHPRIGQHYFDLLTYATPANALLKNDNPSAWLALPEVAAWLALEGHIILSTSLEHSEASEDFWHRHPDVAILPHPTFEGTDKLSKHINSATKKLKQKHMDSLATVGVLPTDTVWDVSDKLKALHPQVMLRPIV